MCLTIAHHDLGPADALVDYAEGLLVLRPTLRPAQQRRAAREVLDAAGVEQAGPGVTCRCGESLPVPGCDRRTLRGLASVPFVVVGAAGMAAAGMPAAADEPYTSPAWQRVVVERGLECAYHDDGTASCLGPLGCTRVERYRRGHVVEFHLDTPRGHVRVAYDRRHR